MHAIKERWFTDYVADQYELDPKDIILSEVLGRGQFGVRLLIILAQWVLSILQLEALCELSLSFGVI